MAGVQLHHLLVIGQGIRVVGLPIPPGASLGSSPDASAKEAQSETAKGRPEPPGASPRGQNGLQEPPAREDFIKRIVQEKA